MRRAKNTAALHISLIPFIRISNSRETLSHKTSIAEFISSTINNKKNRHNSKILLLTDTSEIIRKGNRIRPINNSHLNACSFLKAKINPCKEYSIDLYKLIIPLFLNGESKSGY